MTVALQRQTGESAARHGICQKGQECLAKYAGDDPVARLRGDVTPFAREKDERCSVLAGKFESRPPVGQVQARLIRQQKRLLTITTMTSADVKADENEPALAKLKAHLDRANRIVVLLGLCLDASGDVVAQLR